MEMAFIARNCETRDITELLVYGLLSLKKLDCFDGAEYERYPRITFAYILGEYNAVLVDTKCCPSGLMLDRCSVCWLKENFTS